MRAPYIPALLLALFIVPLSVSADTTAPTLVSVTLQSNNTNTAYARVGDSITVNLTADEDLANTTITILGQSVTARTFSDPKFYFGSHIVADTDLEGDVTFLITYEDLAGNQGLPVSVSTNASSIRIDRMSPTIDPMTDMSMEGDSVGGAVATFSAPAANDTDAGVLTATCSPASGTLFALGTTTVTCTARDYAGNQTDTTFSIEVTDTTVPSIVLIGETALSIGVGETFTDPGVTATDVVDDEVTVTVSGTVDTNTSGDYVLTYSAEDQSGNTAEVTRTVSVVRSGGGGGGGGSSTRRQTTATGSVDGGEVLGASAYNFARTLSVGATGNDVIELQKLLQSRGFFSETPTGYYGPVTAAAVSRYQASKGLEQVGFVGPRTLAALNGETAVTSTDTAAQLAQLYAELERLMSELKKLKGEA